MLCPTSNRRFVPVGDDRRGSWIGSLNVPVKLNIELPLA
jgi:hypothetical protein